MAGAPTTTVTDLTLRFKNGISLKWDQKIEVSGLYFTMYAHMDGAPTTTITDLIREKSSTSHSLSHIIFTLHFIGTYPFQM